MNSRFSIQTSVTRFYLYFCVFVAPCTIINASAFATQTDVVLNEMCPVMTEEKIDPEITTVYRGKTVAFCCDTCLKKFLVNPVRYVDKLPQFASHSITPANGFDETHKHNLMNAHEQDAIKDSRQKELVEITDQHGHDHAASPTVDEREPLLGRLHPVLVHFPLAGLPLALLGFVVWIVTGREAFARADVPPLFAATLASIAAVVTGNIAHDAMRFSETLHIIVEQHQFVSTIVMVIAICLSIIRLWRWNRLTDKWRCVYGCGLVIACALIGFTGYLGGSLVFGPDHLAW